MPEAARTEAPSVPERFEPGSANPSLMRAEHWSRYHFAAQLAAGRRVLDAGCGTGYGMALLRGSGASEIVGVDRSGDAIRSARERNPDALLVEADLSSTTLADESFDLIVCFEVIEHLGPQEDVLDELRRLLAPGGVVLVSSPNPDVYPAGNPHHVRELTPAELRDILGRRFTNVEMLRQNAWLVSAILTGAQYEDSSTATSWASCLSKVDAGEPGAETYAMAMASDAPLPPLAATATLARPDDLEEYAAAIKAMETRVEEAENAVRVAGDLRVAADREAAQAADSRRRAEDQLEEVRADLQATEEHLQRANEAIASITGSLSWRLTSPLRKVRRGS